MPSGVEIVEIMSQKCSGLSVEGIYRGVSGGNLI